MNLHRNKITGSMLLAALILCTSGCGNNSPSSSLSEQLESETSTETTTAEESTTTATEHITTTTTTTTAQTTESPTQEPTEESFSEREILEAICIDMYGELVSPYPVLGENNQIIQYENDADYLMHEAETFPERCLGSISDEDDLIEKARIVWIGRLGAKYIERIESDYIERDGQKIKYERSHPPYSVKYYDEYDAWLIEPNAPAGVTEDGMRFDTPSMPPYFIVRGEDGMIIGALI